MRSSNGTAGPTVDWREWVAFLGYVLATSVAVSVALASVVLLLSTHAEDPETGLGTSASARSPLPPASAVLRQRVQGPEMDLGSTPQRERAPRAGSTAAPDGTRSAVVAAGTADAVRASSAASGGSSRAGAAPTAEAEAAAAQRANAGSDAAPRQPPAANSRPLGKTPVLPESQPTEAAKATGAGAGAGSSAAQDIAVSAFAVRASAIGHPGSGDTTQAFTALLQPIPEPSPSAAAILQPLAPALQPIAPSSEDTALAGSVGASAGQQGALSTRATGLSGT